MKKLVSQQYRAWLDCTDVQAGLALYWWQSLITFGVGRIRVNIGLLILRLADLEILIFSWNNNVVTKIEIKILFIASDIMIVS